jgi:hypothetical protein
LEILISTALDQPIEGNAWMEMTDVTTTQLYCPQDDPAQDSTVSMLISYTSERCQQFAHIHNYEGVELNPPAVEQKPV